MEIEGRGPVLLQPGGRSGTLALEQRPGFLGQQILGRAGRQQVQDGSPAPVHAADQLHRYLNGWIG